MDIFSAFLQTMKSRHTVFVNDKPFRFVDAYEAEEWKGNTRSIFIAEQEMNVEDALTELEETPSHPGFIYLAANPGVAWQLLISYCTLIEASGGLVVNEGNEYLVIFRKGRWDLPKGKLDYDETPEQAGIREVEEECGVKGLNIISALEKTFHTYTQKKKRFLKKTHWYLMKAPKQPLVPQEDEHIEKAEWMSAEKIKVTVFQNSYASVVELLKNNLP